MKAPPDYARADGEAILHFMKKQVADAHGLAVRRALLADLALRAKRVAGADGWRQLVRGIFLAFPDVVLPHIPPIVSHHVSDGVASKAAATNIDVGIVTVIDAERVAAQVALDVEVTKHGDHAEYRERYWFTQLDTASGRSLNVVLTVLAAQRNVPAAILTERLLSRFKPRLCVLVGICAGVEGITKLGDVIVSQAVIDYEGARLELGLAGRRGKPTKRRPVRLSRDIQFIPPVGILADTNSFNDDQLQLKTKVDERLDALGLDATTTQAVKKWRLKSHLGLLLSGGKLIADGSLVNRRLRQHEQIRGAAMEDSGFAQACRFQHPEVPWLVFRGVADLGDGSKRRLKRFQRAAALAAAVAAVSFLQADYSGLDH